MKLTPGCPGCAELFRVIMKHEVYAEALKRGLAFYLPQSWRTIKIRKEYKHIASCNVLSIFREGTSIFSKEDTP